MKTIDAQTLHEQIDQNEDQLVIDVLPEEMFNAQHIPGAVNVPVSDPTFIKQVEDLADTRDDPIVVYCADSECDASPKAAQQLEDNGFTNIVDFEGGIAEWREAGYPVEAAGQSV